MFVASDPADMRHSPMLRRVPAKCVRDPPARSRECPAAPDSTEAGGGRDAAAAAVEMGTTLGERSVSSHATAPRRRQSRLPLLLGGELLNPVEGAILHCAADARRED